MSHRVKEDIYAERVGFLFGEFGKIPGVGAFFFPAVAHVSVVAGEHDHVSFVIHHGAVVRRLAIGVLGSDASVAVAHGEINARDLRLFLKLEDGMENWVSQLQIDHRTTRVDPLNELVVEVVPIFATPKVVYHQEASAVEVTTQDGNFILVHGDVRHAAHDSERVVEKVRIGDVDDFAV